MVRGHTANPRKASMVNTEGLAFFTPRRKDNLEVSTVSISRSQCEVTRLPWESFTGSLCGTISFLRSSEPCIFNGPHILTFFWTQVTLSYRPFYLGARPDLCYVANRHCFTEALHRPGEVSNMSSPGLRWWQGCCVTGGLGQGLQLGSSELQVDYYRLVPWICHAMFNQSLGSHEAAVLILCY